MCMCAPYVCWAPDFLELELWVFVNYHAGARNRPWFFCKYTKYFLLSEPSLSSQWGFFSLNCNPRTQEAGNSSFKFEDNLGCITRLYLRRSRGGEAWRREDREGENSKMFGVRPAMQYLEGWSGKITNSKRLLELQSEFRVILGFLRGFYLKISEKAPGKQLSGKELTYMSSTLGSVP